MNRKCIECAVFLQVTTEQNGETSVRFGTGFFVLCNAGRRDRVLVVTNRHVLEGFTRLELRFVTPEPVLDPSDPFSAISIEQSEVLYYGHVDDSVDLAAIAIDGIIDRITTNAPMFYRDRVLQASDILSGQDVNALEPLEKIFIVSCTNHLQEFGIASPFLKTGILSTYPAYNAGLLLLDIPCFSGYSGSPVFHEGTGQLIGIVKSGVGIKYSGTEISAHQAIAVKASLLPGLFLPFKDQK